MANILHGYEQKNITKPLNISLYNQATLNKTLTHTPIISNQAKTKQIIANPKKNWNKEKARISFSQGPNPKISLTGAHKFSNLIVSIMKIQKWFRKLRTLKKLKEINISLNSSIINKNQQNISFTESIIPKNHKRNLTEIVYRKTPIENKTKLNLNEKEFVKKIINSAKSNTLNYLKLKEQKNQLLPKYTNLTDNIGNTALYYAACFENYEIAKILLKNGANPNIKCENGDTPLHKAFLRNDTLLIGILLEYNANPKIGNNEHKTPLYYAIPDTAKKFGLHNEILINPEEIYY